MLANKLRPWGTCCLALGIVAGGLTPQALAEEWEFFAAGSDSYRHYIDMESIQWGDRESGTISASFSSNQEGDVYSMTLHCDPASANYGTYLLDGYPQPLYLETIVESARSILCLSPCNPFSIPANTFVPDRSTQLADEFWSDRRCPTSVSEPSDVS
ncbi:MAG: hypothetical protein AB4050_00105 [Synechococcus sp.]